MNARYYRMLGTGFVFVMIALLFNSLTATRNTTVIQQYFSEY